MAKILDGLLLLLCAAVCAGAAWMFFHASGQAAFTSMMAITILALVSQNIRLKRRLKELEK